MSPGVDHDLMEQSKQSNSFKIEYKKYIRNARNLKVSKQFNFDNISVK